MARVASLELPTSLGLMIILIKSIGSVELRINIRVQPVIKLNPIDHAINFMYHLYSSAFEQMALKQVDREVLAFVPRCLWDVDCEHYDTCVHELLWQQYAGSIIQNAIKYRDIFLQDGSDMQQMDTLDLLVWYSFHSNITEVIVNIYCALNINELSASLHASHDDMFEIFCKYIKRTGLNE